MVMYESDCRKLNLVYGNLPSAREVVHDILNAPIEKVGEKVGPKHKGPIANETILTVNIKSKEILGEKATNSIVENAKANGFKLTEKDKNYLKFEIPEIVEVSEQSKLMNW